MEGERFPRSNIRSAIRQIHGLWLAWVVAHLAATIVFMEFNEVSVQQALDAWSWPIVRTPNLFFFINGAGINAGGTILAISWVSLGGGGVADLYEEEISLPSLTLGARIRLLLPFTLTALNITSFPAFIYLWSVTY